MASPTPRPHRPLEWRRAWRALQRLIDDPEQTDLVFEIVEALAGNSFERQWQRFRVDPQGRRLLAERPSLLATLRDREALLAMPPGSFGRAYAEFMRIGNLTPDGLVEADAAAAARRSDAPLDDPERSWFFDRLRDVHDLWHVLTGYGMDEAGEAANLAFTFAQVPSLGIGLIVVAGGVLGPRDLGFGWPRYLYRAWRRGRRAGFLAAAPYEALLPLPLDAVRRRLGVQLPEDAHPGGIVAASRGDEAPRVHVRPAWEAVPVA